MKLLATPMYYFWTAFRGQGVENDSRILAQHPLFTSTNFQNSKKSATFQITRTILIKTSLKKIY